MDDVKIGEILAPGDDETQERRAKQVQSKFWPTLKRAARYVPFSRDVVAAFYCATDPGTPTRVRGVLLAALAYFVMPLDILPDFLAMVGFTDDVAVLATAFRMIQTHIKDDHYQQADRALADDPDLKSAPAS
ncbi:YkvA family protein [Rhizobium helianthi]|uniref:YkvA family protein n=1 Tax=Rhizobium helianthi TaxID=1132695 RepID=A0ABW4M4X4_9HYPH